MINIESKYQALKANFARLIETHRKLSEEIESGKVTDTNITAEFLQGGVDRFSATQNKFMKALRSDIEHRGYSEKALENYPELNLPDLSLPEAPLGVGVAGEVSDGYDGSFEF